MSSMSPMLVLSLIALAATVVVALLIAVSVGRRRSDRYSVEDERQAGMRSPAPPSVKGPVPMGPGVSALRTQPNRVEDRAGRLGEVALRPLREADRERYLAAWRGVQAIFVDDPQAGIADADRLIENVLRARGYRLADARARTPLDEGQPDAVRRYWSGHDLGLRRTDPDVQAKDLWAAMAEFQAALDALTAPAEPEAVHSPPAVAGGGRSASRRAS